MCVCAYIRACVRVRTCVRACVCVHSWACSSPQTSSHVHRGVCTWCRSLPKPWLSASAHQSTETALNSIKPQPKLRHSSNEWRTVTVLETVQWLWHRHRLSLSITMWSTAQSEWVTHSNCGGHGAVTLEPAPSFRWPWVIDRMLNSSC